MVVHPVSVVEKSSMVSVKGAETLSISVPVRYKDGGMRSDSVSYSVPIFEKFISTIDSASSPIDARAR